jgi:alpha-L-rhamnosidase
MTWAKGHYNSMYGRIESGWEIKGKGCHYHFSVPANTTATLFLNAVSVNDIRVGDKPFILVSGVKQVGTNNGQSVYKLPPGVYNIQVAGRK